MLTDDNGELVILPEDRRERFSTLSKLASTLKNRLEALPDDKREEDDWFKKATNALLVIKAQGKAGNIRRLESTHNAAMDASLTIESVTTAVESCLLSSGFK